MPATQPTPVTRTAKTPTDKTATTPIEPTAAAESLTGEWIARRELQPQTRLCPRHPPTLTADDPVRVMPGQLLSIDPRADGDRRSLVLGDRRLRSPQSCLGFVAEALRCDRVLSAAGLDGSLDVASQLVVLQRLAVDGVVTDA